MFDFIITRFVLMSFLLDANCFVMEYLWGSLGGVCLLLHSLSCLQPSRMKSVFSLCLVCVFSIGGGRSTADNSLSPCHMWWPSVLFRLVIFPRLALQSEVYRQLMGSWCSKRTQVSEPWPWFTAKVCFLCYLFMTNSGQSEIFLLQNWWKSSSWHI